MIGRLPEVAPDACPSLGELPTCSCQLVGRLQLLRGSECSAGPGFTLPLRLCAAFTAFRGASRSRLSRFGSAS